MSGPMDAKQLAHITNMVMNNPMGLTSGQCGLLLADRDHWEAEAKRYRSRCPVTAEDVEAAGVTRPQFEAWCSSKGLESIHRLDTETVGVNDGDQVVTVRWGLGDRRAIARFMRWRKINARRWDILDEMAAVEVSRDR